MGCAPLLASRGSKEDRFQEEGRRTACSRRYWPAVFFEKSLRISRTLPEKSRKTVYSLKEV